MKSLTSLDLRFCRKVSDAGVRSLRGLPNLQQLWLRDVRQPLLLSQSQPTLDCRFEQSVPHLMRNDLFDRLSALPVPQDLADQLIVVFQRYHVYMWS